MSNISTLTAELLYMAQMRSTRPGSPKMVQRTMPDGVLRSIVMSFEQPSGYYVPDGLLWLCLDEDLLYHQYIVMWDIATLSWITVTDNTVTRDLVYGQLPANVNLEYKGFRGNRGPKGDPGDPGSKGLNGNPGPRGDSQALQTNVVDLAVKEVIRRLLDDGVTAGVPDDCLFYGTGAANLGNDAQVIAYMLSRTKLSVPRINNITLKFPIVGSGVYGWCMFPRSYLRNTDPADVFMSLPDHVVGGWRGSYTSGSPGRIVTRIYPQQGEAPPATKDFVLFRTTSDNIGLDGSWVLRTV